jgi:hypothetical protein
MSPPVPQQPSVSDAARADVASTPPAIRPLPEFQPLAPNSPIDREIERSVRASAALAASRALARASFTDSELAADEADGAMDSGAWIRTEYASLDHSVRSPQDNVPHGGTPRTLVGGSFNPGIVAQSRRGFHVAPIGHSPIKTRTGAEARFMQESRQTPRADRLSIGSARADQTLTLSASHYDKPVVLPMRATPPSPPAARPARVAASAAPAPLRARPRAALSASRKAAAAAGVIAAVVLLGGGVAWKTGGLSHASPTNASLITARAAAQAEAARMLSTPSPQEIPMAATAAGPSSTRTEEEVNAALAAAARAAAVPMASVQAAGPSRVARPMPPFTPANPVVAATTAAQQHSPARGQDNVAAAIANAQSRADNFLAPKSEPPGVKQAE